MESVTNLYLRDELVTRRQRLETVATAGPGNSEILRLLNEVDQALGRMDSGTYGVCEVCHDSIETERLLGDPLLKTCLDHLSAEEQRDLEQDLDLASRIQSELLPKRRLRVGSWNICSHYEAVGPVGGDYCDVVPGKDGEVYFLVGDVSGKGVAASMLMTHLNAMFRSLITVGLPFRELMEHANRVFCNSTMPTFFATLVCAKAAESGEVEVFNAGHCSPLWVQRRHIDTIEATGLPLGMFCSSVYSTRKIRMQTGDMMLLYTDGVTEARNETNEEYGAERLARLAADKRGHAPESLISACLADVARFRGGVPKTDDITVMAVQRNQ